MKSGRSRAVRGKVRKEAELMHPLSAMLQLLQHSGYSAATTHFVVL